MPLPRNIDTRGRLWRGLIALILACIAMGCALGFSGSLRWLAALPGAAAAFVLFEAAAGWCAARTCGYRTRF